MPGEMHNLNVIESISMTFGLGMFGSLLTVVLEKKHPHRRIKKTKKIDRPETDRLETSNRWNVRMYLTFKTSQVNHQFERKGGTGPGP